jgi:hypothetical protein
MMPEKLTIHRVAVDPLKNSCATGKGPGGKPNGLTDRDGDKMLSKP